MTTLTRIHIDRSTRESMGRMAEPYFGKTDVAPFLRQIELMLAARFPKRQISVAHVAHEPDLFIGRIRIGVIVDSELDQGIVFDRPSPEPARAANDDAEALAAVA